MLMCEVLETKGTTDLLHNLPFHEAIRVIYFQFVLLQSLVGADERVCEVCLKVDPRKGTDLADRPLQPLRKLKTNKKSRTSTSGNRKDFDSLIALEA